MKSPIKYRAWHIEESRWVSAEKFLNSTKVSATVLPPSILSIEQTTWIFNLFTGIVAGNRIEIYDGDILMGYDTEGYGPEQIRYSCTSIVSWCNEWGKWIVTEIGSNDKYDLYNYSMIDSVIGNIYENPELVSPL